LRVHDSMPALCIFARLLHAYNDDSRKDLEGLIAVKRTLLLLGISLLISAASFAQTVPLGPYGNIPVNTANTAADTIVLVTGQMYGILTGTPTAAANYTTPTATQLCTVFPFLSSGSATNWAYDWYIKNTSAGGNTITAVAGSGVTLVGTGTTAQNFVRHFKVVFNTCSGTPAVQLISLETSAF
jgi:hypothetical protein